MAEPRTVDKPSAAAERLAAPGEPRPSKRRQVSACGVKGVFARKDGRWVLENASELAMLEALGGSQEGSARLRAMAATLDAGVAGPGDLVRLSKCLQALTDAEEVCWANVPKDLMAAVTVACTHWDHEAAVEWICWVLAARLDDNLTDAWDVEAGWLCWTAKQEDRYPRTWWRTTGWLDGLDSEFWEHLASNQSPLVLAASEVSNPKARPSLLQQYARNYAQSKHWGILDLIASHPRASARQLLALAANRRPKVLLWRTVQNLSAPRRVLDRICSDSFGATRSYHDMERAVWLVAQHPNTSGRTLGQLALSEGAAIRSWVAIHPKTPLWALDCLAGDEEPYVRGGVGGNPSTPRRLLVRLASDRLSEIRAAAGSNPALPARLLRKLACDRTIRVREAVALNDKLPGELIEELARDQHWKVRRAVSWRRDLPPEILARFAIDPHPWIRRCAASDPATPPDALALIAEAADQDVYEWLDANPNTPPPVLLELAQSKNSNTRNQVAENPSAPTEALDLLGEDSDWRVRESTAANPAAPLAVLERLAADRHRFVRSMVAANPAAPFWLVEQLAEDQCYCVFAAAADALDKRRSQAGRYARIPLHNH